MSEDAIIPTRGDLLISEPFLADPNFERSVILLCEHNEEGSFGFVLNKLAEIDLSEVLDEVQDFHDSIHVGGPVQHNTLHYLHRVQPPMADSEPINNGVYWGGDFDELLSLINTRQLTSSDIKFFVGYSGWGPGQLASELSEKTWIVYKKASPELIFDIPMNKLWQEVLRSMGGKYRMFSNYPIDPRLN